MLFLECKILHYTYFQPLPPKFVLRLIINIKNKCHYLSHKLLLDIVFYKCI